MLGWIRRIFAAAGACAVVLASVAPAPAQAAYTETVTISPVRTVSIGLVLPPYADGGIELYPKGVNTPSYSPAPAPLSDGLYQISWTPYSGYPTYSYYKGFTFPLLDDFGPGTVLDFSAVVVGNYGTQTNGRNGAFFVPALINANGVIAMILPPSSDSSAFLTNSNQVSVSVQLPYDVLDSIPQDFGEPVEFALMFYGYNRTPDNRSAIIMCSPASYLVSVAPDGTNETYVKITDAIESELSDYVDAVNDDYQQTWDDVVAQFDTSTPESTTATGFSGVLGGMKAGFTAITGTVVQGTKTVVSTVSNGIQTVNQSVREIPGKVQEGMETVFVPSDDVLADFADDISDAVSDKTGAVGQLGSSFSAALDAVQGQATNKITFPGLSVPVADNVNFEIEESDVSLFPSDSRLTPLLIAIRTGVSFLLVIAAYRCVDNTIDWVVHANFSDFLEDVYPTF